MKKRAITTLLLISMLAAASCGGTGTAEETGGQNETTTGEPQETADPLMDNLGEFNFDGYEYRVLSCTYAPGQTFTLFDVEEESGDVLEDSLYKRNREIEDRFNIVFKSEQQSYENCHKTLINTVSAGEDAYDMIMEINRDAFADALQGYLMPMSEMTYLDPSKPYYLHDINRAFEINGKSFFYYSEESVYTFERASVLAFNKELAAEYNLANYYDMVRDGSWTFDTMFSDARTVVFDIDGNDVMNMNDQYGLIGCGSYVFDGLYACSGELIIEKDKDGIPYFNAPASEKLSNVFDSILAEITGDHVFINGMSDVTAANDMFRKGSSLFLSTVAGRLNSFRDMEQDFGVLPIPKYDETQDNYCTLVVDAWLHVVPITNPNPERTSVIMEALASGSARYVFPAYYDKAMMQKVLRDEDSIEMFDIIRETRIVDLAGTPWLNTIQMPYLNMFLAGQSNYASLSESLRSVAETTIEDALNALDKIQ